MKKGFAVLVVAGALGFSSAALAADRPVPAARVAPAFSWTGWYVGVNAGFAFGESDLHTCSAGTGFFTPESRSLICSTGQRHLEPDGFTGGGQVGWLWQAPQGVFGGNYVIGVEADFQAFHLRDSDRIGPFSVGTGFVSFTHAANVSTDWLFTLRARGGLAFGNWLIYATGGLAITELESTFTYADTCVFPCGGGVSPTGFATGTASETIAGWTAGGGVEVAVVPGWSVRAEYLFVRFDDVSTNAPLRRVGTVFPGEFVTHTADLDAHIVRGAINFRFAP